MRYGLSTGVYVDHSSSYFNLLRVMPVISRSDYLGMYDIMVRIRLDSVWDSAEGEVEEVSGEGEIICWRLLHIMLNSHRQPLPQLPIQNWQHSES